MWAASSLRAIVLDELVPIENAAMPDRTVIEWDKDDLDTLGLLQGRRGSAWGCLSAIRPCVFT